MDNRDLASNVVPMRRTAKPIGPPAEPEVITDPLRPLVDRALTDEEASVLRAQIPAGGLQRATLEAFLEAGSCGWRHLILCHNSWLIGFVAALPRRARA